MLIKFDLVVRLRRGFKDGLERKSMWSLRQIPSFYSKKIKMITFYLINFN